MHIFQLQQHLSIAQSILKQLRDPQIQQDRWRFRLAAQRLSCSDMPVKQIALELGFSDQATFRRAFAHWAGKPPGAWRRERGIVAL